MLRASKKIEFENDHLTSQNGVLLSPVINLCGLILRSDKPVPEAIKDFLKNKGVQVKRVLYKNELYIRLTGHYMLSRAEVEQFNREHTDLIDEQKNGLENVPSAIHLQEEIIDKIHKIGEPRTFTYQGTAYTSRAQGIISGGNVVIETGEIFHNTGRVGSRTNLLIDSPCILERGQQLDKIGFFSESLANNNIKLKTQNSKFENSLVESGETLKIETKDASSKSETMLELDSNIHWFNNPHPELLKSSEATSTKELLATADDMLMRIQLGASL